LINDEENKDEQSPEEQAPEEAPEQQVPEAEDQAPSAEPAPEAAQEDQPEAEDQPEPEAATPAAEAETAAPEAEEKPGKGAEKQKDVVPGAELDPIAIESEKPMDAEERARREAEQEERAKREAAVLAEQDEDEPVATKVAKLSGDSRYLATGKRKSSVARVILTPGSGAIEVNKRKLEEYFPRAYLQTVAKQALVQTGYEGNVDVRVRVHGGGISGQASAVRHGIARALCEVDPELRIELKRRGMLTRDARVKERRKAGLKKARKKPQFSKR
jgi:small subunit ribosomal protein S9